MKKQRSSKTPTLSESQISDLSRQFLLSRPLQEEFTAKTVELIKALLHVQRIEAHLIESRTKELESFQEKINRSAHKYQNTLNEVTDLSGIRIIVYYEKELNTISELIAREFDVDWSNSSDPPPPDKQYPPTSAFVGRLKDHALDSAAGRRQTRARPQSQSRRGLLTECFAL